MADSPSDYERFSSGLLQDPYPLYTELRDHDPVHWSEPANS